MQEAGGGRSCCGARARSWRRHRAQGDPEDTDVQEFLDLLATAVVTVALDMPVQGVRQEVFQLPPVPVQDLCLLWLLKGLDRAGPEFPARLEFQALLRRGDTLQLQLRKKTKILCLGRQAVCICWAGIHDNAFSTNSQVVLRTSETYLCDVPGSPGTPNL